MSSANNYKRVIMKRHTKETNRHSRNMLSTNSSADAFYNYMVFKELDRGRLIIHRNDAAKYANKVATKTADMIADRLMKIMKV